MLVANFENEQRQEVTKLDPICFVATEIDGPAWDKYVRGHDGSNIYQLWGWKQIIESIHKHRCYFIVARRLDQIVGVLPLAHNKTVLFGNALVSLPFCPYAGPIADDQETHDALLEAARKLCSQLGASHLEVRVLPSEFDFGSQSPKHSEFKLQDLYVTFRRRLADSEEAMMNDIPRKQRAMVRKGIKNELRARQGTIAEFFDLYADNVLRHGTPGSPKSFFQAMQNQFGRDCEISIVERKDGLALSGVLSLFYKDEVLPFYAGDKLESRDLAANDFKYWELMRTSAQRGAKIFDYGRSKKKTGPFAFKSNWGFEPTQLLYRYYDLIGPIPENNPLNPKYRLMIAVWRKLPRFVVDFLGPFIVRGLG